MIKDNQGRIMGVDRSDNIHTGHSVCNKCGKDMPVCWNTICAGCQKTFCYEDSYVQNGHWYCKKCKDNIIQVILSKIEEVIKILIY